MMYKGIELKKELVSTKDPSGFTIITCDVSKHKGEIDNNSLVRARNRHLITTYGITLEDYNQILAQQAEKCAICGKHQSEFNYDLYVDHDHKTNKVRGLLCCGCNTGLGHFEQLKDKMQNYLDHHEKIA